MDWALFFANVSTVIAVLMFFVPGVVAFFSLRHAAFSFVAHIVAIAVAVSAMRIIEALTGTVLNLNTFQLVLMTYFGMAIVYSFSWAGMHFALPKALLSDVSKKVRVVVSAIALLLAPVFLVILLLV